MGNADFHPNTRQNSRYYCVDRQRKRLKPLDKPQGYIDAMCKDNLGWQMRYSVKSLEDLLVKNGTPHVLQLGLEGSEKSDLTCAAMGIGRTKYCELREAM